jgi:hypothetical protein
MGMGTKARRETSGGKRGGYEPGPKSMADLRPPPKTPGAGSKPKDNSSQMAPGRDR